VFITIQEGCNNACTFCIVPFTRGREVSRPLDAILAEARMHADCGAREVVLLGQNVNSWGRGLPGHPSFAELLARVAEIDGLERIRFTSPHPRDYGDDLIAAYRTIGKLCPSAHLPLQSGSSRVLAAMRRGYDRDRFVQLAADLRAARPEIEFSTDVIVGFPGETREDFDETLNVLRALRFAQVYAFVFSPRPGTAASTLADPIAETVKKAWLQELLELQRQIQAEDHRRHVGQQVDVLFTSWRSGILEGRSAGGRVVHAPGDESNIGRLVAVKVERATAHALYGLPIASTPRSVADGH
jgi:tRNA-2-methylthio-N6-dimethylallyladenosine synthase